LNDLPLIPIGELVEVALSVNPKRLSGHIKYIDLGAVDRDRKLIEHPSIIDPSTAPSRARQLLRAGDVLVSTVRPNLNAVARVPHECDEAIGSTGFCVLRPSSKLDSNYLFHWVQTPYFVREMTKMATGASYPAVSDRIVKESTLPLPDLNHQKRIAEILGSAARIQHAREATLSRAADLDASIFFRVFGDPVTNPKHWDDARTLGDLTDVTSGVTKGRQISHDERQLVPYLSVSNVQDGRLDMQVVKELDASAAEIDRLRLVKDDLLMTEGGDPDKLGRAALWDNQLPLCIHQNHVFRVRILDRHRILPEFLLALVSSDRGRRYFLRAAKQTTGIASINKSQLKAFPLLLPPIRLQETFAQFMQATASVRRAMVAHASRLDAMFASLQSRAFKGEL
jgi:type I restriction enzyme S subunit